jgi:hypothetical protein
VSNVTKWQIIFYNMLHPKEPRVLAETQFTNKRICIFTKHKRYSKYNIWWTLFHESLHILFHWKHKPNQGNSKIADRLDDVLDLTDYIVTKQINKKKIIREKGWGYFLNTRHPIQLGVRSYV